MEDDSDLVILASLREHIKAQVDACNDAGLLDFVYRLLAEG